MIGSLEYPLDTIALTLESIPMDHAIYLAIIQVDHQEGTGPDGQIGNR